MSLKKKYYNLEFIEVFKVLIANYNSENLLKISDKQEEWFKWDSILIETRHNPKNLDQYLKSYIAFAFLLDLFFYQFILSSKII